MYCFVCVVHVSLSRSYLDEPLRGVVLAAGASIQQYPRAGPVIWHAAMTHLNPVSDFKNALAQQ